MERILAFIHPEFEGSVPPEFSAEPDTYRGHDGIRRYFRTFQDAMEEVRFQPERFWDAGDAVVVEMRLTARGRQTSTRSNSALLLTCSRSSHAIAWGATDRRNPKRRSI